MVNLTAIAITAMVCATLVVLAYIGMNGKDKDKDKD